MTTVSAADVDQLDQALHQIATDMISIRNVLKDAVPDGKYDHRCASIELLASHAGALADRWIQTVGSVQVRGEFEKWFDD